MEARITFRAEIFIKGKNLDEIEQKWEDMPLFSSDALECGADYVELDSIEEVSTCEEEVSTCELIMIKPKVGMKFYDINSGVHTITKVTDEFGGGIYHTYTSEKGVITDAFMLRIAFDRLLKARAICIIN